MKKFTVKDFIFYNGPCFSCGNKVLVKLVCIENNTYKDIPQTLQDGYIDVTLKVKYAFTLTLRISINTNKYQVSDLSKLRAYLNTKDICFVSTCKNCRNIITSNPIDFDNIGRCKAITIKTEVLNVYEFEPDNYKIYNLISDYSDNKTEISICYKKTPNVLRLTIPLLPLYKFKTREKLFSKLKTFILFS